MLVRILASIAIGSNVLLWAVQYAYIQRGYVAIGGEYLFALLAAILSYWLIKKFQ